MHVRSQPQLSEAEYHAGVRLIRGQGITHDFTRHAHQSLLLVLVTKGMREMDVPGRTLRIMAGHGFCLPPDYPHACRSFQPHDYYAVSVPVVLWQSLQSDSHVLPAFKPIEAPKEGLDTLRTLIAVLRLDPDPMSVESALIDMMAYLQPGEVQSASPRQQSMVRQVREWLTMHYAEPVRLKDLARQTGWSAGMVNRIFRSLVGVPPYEFLMHQRLREVARLLRAGDDSLADIAARTGFADQSHMHRLFRRAYGVTPMGYRLGSGSASDSNQRRTESGK